ncbi:hypothetical protein HJFPF1_12183 [Paramyrothecium foliicola]|nr:hypothetical protein HJFPF1_12183 [Paramyrothecium foliicola]
MAAKTTVTVPHLGGINVGYRLSGGKVDPAKPTVLLINSMCTTSSLYETQFNSSSLTNAVNLLAIEPLGHGATSTATEHWTYWDSAWMALQTMEALGVEKAFAVGTSQGGWIVVRMALLAPSKMLGLLPLGTSMDYESAASREGGCWDPKTQLKGLLDKWSIPTPDFVVDESWRKTVGQLGFAGALSQDELAFWDRTQQEVYNGEEGRKKLRMALLNLLHRDGLLARLGDVKCPVYWLQGPEDPVYGKIVPTEHIKLFTSSPEATLTFIDKGGHYLNATSPKETEEAILKMVKKYA